MHVEERIENDVERRMFSVQSTDPVRTNLLYLCQAEDESGREKWTSCLRRQLQTQLDFLKALQAPIAYHNSLSKQL